MADIGDKLKKGAATVALLAELASFAVGCGSAPKRTDADYRNEAISCAMIYARDNNFSNYQVKDSTIYSEGRVYTIYHPNGQPTQNMRIFVPNKKNEKAFLYHPD